MKATIELAPGEVKDILCQWCKAKGIGSVKDVSFNLDMQYHDRQPGQTATAYVKSITIEYVLE